MSYTKYIYRSARAGSIKHRQTPRDIGECVVALGILFWSVLRVLFAPQKEVCVANGRQPPTNETMNKMPIVERSLRSVCCLLTVVKPE